MWCSSCSPELSYPRRVSASYVLSEATGDEYSESVKLKLASDDGRTG